MFRKLKEKLRAHREHIHVTHDLTHILYYGWLGTMEHVGILAFVCGALAIFGCFSVALAAIGKE